MRAGQPDEAPRPWHDAIGVVAAAAGRQPAPAGVPVRERVDQPRRLAHRRGRHAQVRQRVPGVRIAAVLRDDQVRAERSRELGKQRADRLEPGRLAGARLERHVDGRPGRHALAQLPHPARPREQVPAGLVERDGQDAGIVPVDRLDAVAVVDVEVHVQDAQPVTPRPGDRERRVVVDAEPRRSIGPSRDGGRRPGGRRARRRRAGSPPSPAASRRRPSRRPRASRRTAGRRRLRRSRPPRRRRTGSPRTA